MISMMLHNLSNLSLIVSIMSQFQANRVRLSNSNTTISLNGLCSTQNLGLTIFDTPNPLNKIIVFGILKMARWTQIDS